MAISVLHGWHRHFLRHHTDVLQAEISANILAVGAFMDREHSVISRVRLWFVSRATVSPQYRIGMQDG